MASCKALAGAVTRLAHPQRDKAILEFLSRPVEALKGPSCISHLALLHAPTDTGRVEAGGGSWPALEELCNHFPDSQPRTFKSRSGFFRTQLDEGLWCRWELYDAFHTYTFIRTLPSVGEPQLVPVPFALSPMDGVPLSWLESLPKDSMIAAIHLELWPVGPGWPKLTLATIKNDIGAFIAERRIYGSEIHGGAARAYTDFMKHNDGFSRVLVQDSRLGAGSVVDLGPGQVVQQLLGLEVFKSLSLIGEPWAGHMSRRIQELNQRQLQLMLKAEKLRMKQRAGCTPVLAGKERSALLEELCWLHLQLEELTAKYKPRLQRSSVWHQHANDLNSDLREAKVEGCLRIGNFTRHRLEELEKDRRSIEREAQDLCLRLQRSVQLLNVEVASVRMEASHTTQVKVERMTLLLLGLSLLLGARELHELHTLLLERVPREHA